MGLVSLLEYCVTNMIIVFSKIYMSDLRNPLEILLKGIRETLVDAMCYGAVSMCPPDLSLSSWLSPVMVGGCRYPLSFDLAC